MPKMSSSQLHQWAMSMYLHENKTQAEIAEICGVSRQTIIRWCKSERWEEQKVSLTMTRKVQVKNLQLQIAEINKKILERPEGSRYANSKESDTILKLTTAVNKLETEMGIHEIVGVAQEFISWLRPLDNDMARTITDLFTKFINTKV